MANKKRSSELELPVGKQPMKKAIDQMKAIARSRKVSKASAMLTRKAKALVSKTPKKENERGGQEDQANEANPEKKIVIARATRRA